MYSIVANCLLTETTESVECASVVETRQRVEQLLLLLNEAVN